MQRFSLFIEEVLLVEIQQPIVIFVEEIDSLLSLQFAADDFFILIRSFYENRTQYSDYYRLTFALVGVITPLDLIRNQRSSAFNIGSAVEMSGFTIEEAQPLLLGLTGKVSAPQDFLEAVLKWTEGQPFLTQKLLSLVIHEAETKENLHLSPADISEWIAQIVQERIIENWEAQDVPQHLGTLQQRILRIDEQGRGKLLGLYQQILINSSIDTDNSYEQMQLRLTGLVIKEGRKAQGLQLHLSAGV